MPEIIFTVTNDLSYDQRMHRIAGSLSAAGYGVLLVGRKRKNSVEAGTKSFRQKRLSCFFEKGPAFYIEFQVRLFCFLLFRKADIICAVDLDTILPCYFISVLKRTKRIFDAHELFTEQEEVIRRPFIQKIWRAIECFAVPRFRNGYTVNGFIAGALANRYGVHYGVIRNLPLTDDAATDNGTSLSVTSEKKTIIYQGAVNEGRCFESLVPAMKSVDATLLICGEGNFYDQVKQLIGQHGVSDKVVLKGYVLPDTLKQLTRQAYIGITLFDAKGLNQFQSLSNRFFDYMMAGIPQVCVCYPEYEQINNVYDFAWLIHHTDEQTVADGLNRLLNDEGLYLRLKENCRKAALVLNWKNESLRLLDFYAAL